jgi:hypothetical protein
LPSLVAPLISAVLGIAGVVVGGWLTGYHQRQQRRQAAIREQLEHFYSPMVALAARIRAKRQTRGKVHDTTQQGWREEVDRALGPEQRHAMEAMLAVEFGKLVEDDIRRLRDELMPLYHAMLDCFTGHMWLAELSTRQHFDTLVEFVDIADRAIAGTLPASIANGLENPETGLYPLYADLEQQFERLRVELKESSGLAVVERHRTRRPHSTS